MRKGLLLVQFFCLYLCGTGQQIAFTHLNVENGLSQNSVLAIAQDARGFMWFGNRYGLNRYDGRNFRLYKYRQSDSNSLVSDYILSLLSDADQTLWVGTVGGLCRYEPEKDHIIRTPLTDEKGKLINHSINSLYGDRAGRLWVASSNGLFVAEKGQRDRFLPAGRLLDGSGSILSQANIRDIYEDSTGVLWIASYEGLTRIIWKDGKGRCTQYKHGGAGTLSDDLATAVMDDGNGGLWVGTQRGGLDRFDRSREQFIAQPGMASNSIRKIIRDKEGRLWIGTQDGLTILDPANGQSGNYRHDAANRQSLSQNSIYSLFRDASGSIWIGTYFGGVNITYSYATPFTTYETGALHASINNNVISGFAEDLQHNLWIGTEGGGLNYFDRATGQFAAFTNNPGDPSSLGSNLVKSVYRDREGRIWAGTHGGGLDLWDPVHRRFRRYLYKDNDGESLTAEIVSIMEDEEGRFWVGSQAGLRVFTLTGDAFQPWTGDIIMDPLRGHLPKVIYEDAQKNIWVGTSTGVFVLHHGGRRFETVSASSNVNSILQDEKGNIWMAAYYEGLMEFNQSGKMMADYTEKDGLPNNNVIGILADGRGNLWLSTANGLSRFDPVARSFKNYTSSDGLPANEFNYNSYFKDSRGELFFGGFNGFTGFFPDRIEINDYVAPMVFTGLKLFNSPVQIDSADGILDKDINLAGHIRLKYDQDAFTVGFALLNYVKPEKNRYAYLLEGFDKNWNEVTTASATYTNLPAGDFILRVRGANNDGVWSREIRLAITVLPPFWRTWWAYCIYALALGGLLFLINRFFFLRALLKRENALHQAKLNFFTNISHEIRTHLALVIGPVERLLLGRKEEEDRRQLLRIRKNSESLLQLVNELMDFRKAESGNLTLHPAQVNLVAMLQEIQASFQNVAETRKIRLDLASVSDNIGVWLDKEQMAKVFFNLLSNAFKFTPDQGTISILAEENGSEVITRVIDNGKGIAPANLDKLFLNYYQENDYGVQNTGYGIGLALSQSIVHLHKGTIEVSSDPAPSGIGQITCFTVRLPRGSEPPGLNNREPKPPAKNAKNTMPASMEAALYTETGLAVDGEYAEPAENGATAVAGLTILLVEDNAELRAFIRDVLQGRYRIVEAPDGEAGWELALEHIPDLIISDVMMPGIDGFVLCGRLKSDERTSHIPVILLTAKTATIHQLNGLGMGADAYIAKPFSMHVLDLQIRNLLTARETMRQKFSREFKLEPRNIVINTVDEQFLDKAIRFIEENMEDPEFGVQSLSTHMAMSQPVLYKKLKALTDLSVNDFIKQLRLKKAAQLLQQRNLTVYEVAYAVGYSDRKYFSREFKKEFGKTPSEFAA